MYPRLLKIDLNSSQSAFLFGPRGTGKTFWLKQHLLQATFIDLLRTDTFIRLLSNPSCLETILPPHPTQWVVIDEVQKVPALLNEVHRLIEQWVH